MNRTGFLILLLLVPVAFQAQILDKPVPNKKEKALDQRTSETDTSRYSSRSTSNAKLKAPGALITDYKIISHKNDTTFVDTTLTIQKEYKYNYLRKDNFNLISFSNIGQTYNTLSNDFKSTRLLPEFGARAKHFNFMEIEDTNYFYVPTPLTELMYKTAFEQGQLLDAFFTVNTSKQLNFSLAYKGLRSLGKYQHILTSTGNFRFTTNYKTKNNKYNLRAHIVMQDVFNQENGGLIDSDLENFESGDPEYLDRSIFDVSFENAENIIRGKRFHLDHSYTLINQKDSLTRNELKIHNILSVVDKYYQFEQSSQNDFFGDAFKSSSLFDKVTFDEFNGLAGVSYNNNTIGKLGFALNYTNYNYGYNRLVVLNESNIINRFKGDIISFKADYRKSFKNFDLSGELGSTISGDFTGNYLLAQINYNFNDKNSIQLQLNSNSRAPNYNFLLYQSDYINYNWQNDFKNIRTNQFSAKLNSEKLLDLSVDFTTIDNYTYFQKNSEEQVKPFQNSGTIIYLRVKAGKELKYKNFALDNTIMYQNVQDDNQSLNVPEIITRNTLYYSNHFFKKALFLQTGVIFNYFTKYNMNAYDPLLSEFYTQNNNQLGNFPRLDFFVNAKIRQTRIYLKAEHFNSSWTGYNYYSAPNYPYRDFIVRFGLVWNFFL
jgi:hypothetical protein